MSQVRVLVLAGPLVVLALFDRLQGKYDLHCLTPKSGFISVQALEDDAVQVRKTQKAVGQLPRRPTIIMIDSLEAVRSILLVSCVVIPCPLTINGSEQGSGAGSAYSLATPFSDPLFVHIASPDCHSANASA